MLYTNPNIKKHILIPFIAQLILVLYLAIGQLYATNQFNEAATSLKISISGCVVVGYCIDIESSIAATSTIVLDLDNSGSYEPSGLDITINNVQLKIGKNCIPWDGYTGKGVAINKAINANVMCTTNSETIIQALQIYPICAPTAKDSKDSTSQNVPLVVSNTKLRRDVSFINTDPDIEKALVFTPFINFVTSKGGKINMDTLGRYTYIPPKNFIGFDEFTYTVCSSVYKELCGSAVVKIKVLSSGFETPTANKDYYTTKQNLEKSANVTDNDVGARICKASVANATTATGGKISMNTNGAFNYNPPTDFVGLDSFNYQLCNAIVPELCVSAWVFITVILQKEIIVPSGFTPNNDGVNDFFEIQNIEQYENEVKIFNRWGNIVYKANNYDNKEVKWEAKSGSDAVLKTDLPEGTYFYLIDLKDGKPPKTGYIMVIK